jgi:uncharacterized protein YciI
MTSPTSGRQHIAKVDRSADRVTLVLSGPRLAGANAERLVDCFNTLLGCAEDNGCFDKGLSIVCLETVARHDRECGCTSQAFGLANTTRTLQHKHLASLDRSADQISIVLSGPRVAQADLKMLTDCFNTMLGCAEDNGCFDKGFSIACLETVARHNRECGCTSLAFGLAAARK